MLEKIGKLKPPMERETVQPEEHYYDSDKSANEELKCSESSYESFSYYSESSSYFSESSEEQKDDQYF